ncbi:hypothetical protein M9458_006094, partial [Cirrhinus mrigala]
MSLQVTELAVHTNPEAGLERLVPLVDYLEAWKLLPNVSAWVLRTVERGYRIQFGAPPPPFNGVFPTVVSPEQGLVMEQEVDTLLRKEAIEVVPPHDRESGFYSRYSIVPKKDGGLRPFLDLRQLNHSVMWLKFGMLIVSQVVPQIRSEDWFVTIDLKDVYFHVSILPQHRKFLRENHLSRHVLSPARIESILTAVTRVKEGRSLTVKQFQRLLGLMAAASNVVPFGLLYMRPLQWWLRTKGFSPRGNPFRMIKVTRRCLRALDMWKKPWFLSQGPVLGAPCRLVTLATDASLTDNTAVVYYINHQGGLRSYPLYKLAHQILVWSQGKLLLLRAVHVPGHLNMGADVLSRQGPRPGEWMLHPEVVKQIWRVFGQAQRMRNVPS